MPYTFRDLSCLAVSRFTVPDEPGLIDIAQALSELDEETSPRKWLAAAHPRTCARIAVTQILQSEEFEATGPRASGKETPAPVSDADLSRILRTRIGQIAREADPEMAHTHPLLLNLCRYATRTRIHSSGLRPT